MLGALIIRTHDATHRMPCEIHGQPPTGRFELVFTTALSAYVESCTDPSYAGQALVFAHPVVGAHGAPETAEQSSSVQPAIVILAAPTMQFAERIAALGGCAITCADTRSIVMHAKLGATVHVEGHDGPCVIPMARPALRTTLAASDILIIDFGCKRSIELALAHRRLTARSVPAELAAQAIAAGGIAGILLSNGAGDPRHDACGAAAAATAIASGLPTLGICYGHQLLAIADGLSVHPLHSGHRGTNHPIINTITGRVSITSHNHGFTVSEPTSDDVTVTYRSVLDGTVEGIVGRTFSGVQFHPEGAPGPRLDEVMDSFAMATNGARRSA